MLCALICVLLASCQTAKKSQPNDVFTVNLNSPQYQIGEVDFQTNPPLGIGKIKIMTVPVLYFPNEDAVVIKLRYEYTTFHQCWNKDGRKGFIDALQKYNEDYDIRSLGLKGRKAKRCYGTVNGWLIWQQAAFTVRASGDIKIELGYTFKDKAPYFTANQLSAEYVDRNSRNRNRSSPVMPIYFTRAQASRLAAIFDQGFIDGLNISSMPVILPETQKDDWN